MKPGKSGFSPDLQQVIRHARAARLQPSASADVEPSARADPPRLVEHSAVSAFVEHRRALLDPKVHRGTSDPARSSFVAQLAAGRPQLGRLDLDAKALAAAVESGAYADPARRELGIFVFTRDWALWDRSVDSNRFEGKEAEQEQELRRAIAVVFAHDRLGREPLLPVPEALDIVSEIGRDADLRSFAQKLDRLLRGADPVSKYLGHHALFQVCPELRDVSLAALLGRIADVAESTETAAFAPGTSIDASVVRTLRAWAARAERGDALAFLDEKQIPPGPLRQVLGELRGLAAMLDEPAVRRILAA